MLSLTSSERSCWITLLCYSSVNDNGMITFLSEQQLMIQAGLDFTCDEWNRTVGILEKLVKLKMITNDNGMITVINWYKRQETSLTSYERVKKHREKKRNDNAKITLEENRIEENRIDNTTMSVKTDAFNTFWLTYPKKEQKKKAQEIWQRKKLDSYLSVIIEFIKNARATDRWKKGFIKMPNAFLNGECWNDDLTSYMDKNLTNQPNALILK